MSTEETLKDSSRMKIPNWRPPTREQITAMVEAQDPRLSLKCIEVCEVSVDEIRLELDLDGQRWIGLIWVRTPFSERWTEEFGSNQTAFVHYNPVIEEAEQVAQLRLERVFEEFLELNRRAGILSREEHAAELDRHKLLRAENPDADLTQDLREFLQRRIEERKQLGNN